jgi:hypothetical protein
VGNIPGLTDLTPLLSIPTLTSVYADLSGAGLIDCSTLDTIRALVDYLNPPRDCRMLVTDVVFEDPLLGDCVRDLATQ